MPNRDRNDQEMTEIDPFTHKIWVNGSIFDYKTTVIDPFTHFLWVNGAISVIF